MKKQYMTPQCTVVKLNMQSLLNTGSNPEVKKVGGNTGIYIPEENDGGGSDEPV